MEAIVYKTILSYEFVENQTYKVGNQWIDGSIGSIDVWFDGLMDGWMDRSMH